MRKESGTSSNGTRPRSIHAVPMISTAVAASSTEVVRARALGKSMLYYPT